LPVFIVNLFVDLSIGLLLQPLICVMGIFCASNAATMYTIENC